MWLLHDMHSARKQGPVAMAQRQRARVSEMVAFVRANSPFSSRAAPAAGPGMRADAVGRRTASPIQTSG